jgi:hypothetical protein
MVQTGRFEKFLEVVIRLLRLALEVTLDGCDTHLIRVVRFLLFVITTGSNYDPLEVPLLPPFAAFCGTFVSGFGWCHSAAAEGRFPITSDKDGPDRLLIRAMPGGDIKQLMCPWLFRAEVASLQVVLSAPLRVPCAVLGLCSSSPWRAWRCTWGSGHLSGWLRRPWTGVRTDEDGGCCSYHGGFCGCLSLVALRATRARDQDHRPALEGPLRLLRSGDAEYPLQLVVHPIHPVCGGVQVECPEERQR